jgi:hypothetical protein
VTISNPSSLSSSETLSSSEGVEESEKSTCLKKLYDKKPLVVFLSQKLRLYNL